MKLRNFIQRTRDERGITGLETAIILIAFVVVATVFAFVVLTTGIFSAERGKETVFAGLQKARGTMEVRGGIVVNALTTAPAVAVNGTAETLCNNADTDTDTVVDDGCPESIATGSIQFSVATTAGGEPVPLDPSATQNRTVLAYRDDAFVLDDVTYTATQVVGDGDTLLEPGELFTVAVDVAVLEAADVRLAANDRFTFEVQTPVGAVLDLTRSLPAEIDTVMQLH
jgi:flagellin FlaB